MWGGRRGLKGTMIHRKPDGTGFFVLALLTFGAGYFCVVHISGCLEGSLASTYKMPLASYQTKLHLAIAKYVLLWQWQNHL